MTLATDHHLAALNVSRETEVELRAFEALVAKWTPRINLIAKRDISSLWQRHIIDSAQIFQHVRPTKGTWVDLGSGGGFPAIVLAIMSRDVAPELRFVLVESDQRKSAFLRTAIREHRLNATVLAERIEVIDALNADFLSARALDSLSHLLSFASRHLKPDGLAIFQKGRQADDEIAAAKSDWGFEVVRHPSITDPTAATLIIQRISRV